MDIVIKKKKWTVKKLLIISSIAVVFAAVIALYMNVSVKSHEVSRSRITISEITQGIFSEYIAVTGVAQPVATIYLDAAEGGRVEEKYVEDGALLKKGDAILRLSNTDIELSLANQETSVFNLLTQMQISQNAARQNTIGKLNQMADADNMFREAERLYLLNKELYKEKVISGQEFKQSQIAYEYQLKKRKLASEILQQDSSASKKEYEQTIQSYERTRNALAVMRKKVGDLIVRAPLDGQLTSLDAETGQNKNKGERLGQIDVLSGFKVQADVDEHYISRIFTGLEGEFTFNDTVYTLYIKKIYTQVINGRFKVDMAFNGAPPRIRKGQTMQVRLRLSNATKALLLPKGGFYQQTGGSWIYKLDGSEKKAYKYPIEIGRQNPDYYEVLNGLQTGEKVITSGYQDYQDNEILILNDN